MLIRRAILTAVDSGKRLYSAIPLAVTSAGLSLFDKEDYYAGRALSADFIGNGWRGMLGFPDAPVYAPDAAGNKLAKLQINTTSHSSNIGRAITPVTNRI